MSACHCVLSAHVCLPLRPAFSCLPAIFLSCLLMSGCRCVLSSSVYLPLRPAAPVCSCFLSAHVCLPLRPARTCLPRMRPSWSRLLCLPLLPACSCLPADASCLHMSVCRCILSPHVRLPLSPVFSCLPAAMYCLLYVCLSLCPVCSCLPVAAFLPPHLPEVSRLPCNIFFKKLFYKISIKLSNDRA